jgi:hypothetical protein
MTKTLTSMLVGMHFVPPSKILLEHIPAGTSLRLEADPENPYDEHAIKVFVEGASIPESQHEELAVKLPGAGQDLETVIAPEAWWMLGHVAASGGKPMAKARLVRGDLVGNLEFHEVGLTGKARLGFDGSGMILVELEVES